ncbi:unnamed protein product [Vitrella brassicaformis CCMP3155]|uniref:Alanine--tRNA ligase n=1 Tax=Vitrella brassicaformis (strain CCMP3155) TaxID=1169540 RepID=A0A0G4H5V7_VITBC|nr:unnamed protein product [Vitrella brassicaformis CCMP3155]|mmetsp:Transcript_21066/g.51362  ORF Transcript_21066/g.51362 Transcript_21066/m.51362 type:complete len:982 (-) Transcript_21066:420-3365(-)|eukprot:CEM39205.1 unnamed protein product [Vitrella brassicaformis CCMP3155]
MAINGTDPPPPSSKWATGGQVRQAFIDFFTDKCGHQNWPSSPVVPHNDPSLLFINAGMNQFKPIFLGNVDANTPFAKLKRVANTQKCIRAGGKHNDLEDVGKDVYHHTFFEMLGNWSFGDYFKEEAIDWAWQLLTQVYGIDPERLYATYFKGDSSCPPDDEARRLWLKYLPESRVLAFGAKDNFWEMADTGPCGPCSEIHYDRIGGRDASSLVNEDDPDVLEIWNLVFMQFNREKDRSLTPLPAPCVDTGMGLERVASVLMGVRSNYDTDLFTKIFTDIQRAIPGLRPYTGLVGSADADRVDMAYRVVADHIRTLTVAISDGAQPSNEGRGYVLRRILRRAVRYGRQFLGAPKAQLWFSKLLDSVVDILGDAFPELKKDPESVRSVIASEEQQFSKTLENGLKEFDRILLATQNRGQNVFPGGDPGAFVLYTTYGFPLDLTQLMAAEQNMRVDTQEFDRKFAEHQQLSRESGKFKGGGGLKELTPDQLNYLKETLNVDRTDDSPKYVWDTDGAAIGRPVEATLKAIWDGESFLEMIEHTEEKRTVGLIFDQTTFYAEAGGQIFDTGNVDSYGQYREGGFVVTECQKFGNYIMHIGHMQSGNAMNVGDSIKLHVDYSRRAHIAKNHTATHLLNFALRKVLGSNCDQAGSLVEPSRLRFDFNWGKPIETQELEKIEEIMKEQIALKLPVYKKEVPYNTAKAINGLRAVFGEQYPDPVRVVTVGAPIEQLTENPSGELGLHHSVEFCGGTHLDNAKQIKDFRVLSEEALGKGVRRMYAVTGRKSDEANKEEAETSQRIEEVKKLSDKELDEAITSLRAYLDDSKILPLISKRRCLKTLDDLKSSLVNAGKKQSRALIETAKKMGSELAKRQSTTDPFLVLEAKELDGDGKALDALANSLKAENASLPFLVVTANAKSLSAICVVPDALKDTMSAKTWLNECLGACGGKGGGQDTRAVGNSRNADQVQGALDAAESFAKRTLQGA